MDLSEATPNLRPPARVKAALRRGLALHEDGHSGDGLQPETVAWARRMASGDPASPEKVRAMRAWFARHDTPDERAARERDETSPANVAWLLWGGDAGRAWAERMVERMERMEEAKGAVTNAEDTAEDEGAEAQCPECGAMLAEGKCPDCGYMAEGKKPKAKAKMVEADRSSEERNTRVFRAVCQRYGQRAADEYGPPGWVRVHATYDDAVIFDYQEKTWRAPYTMAKDGTVTLGEPEQVVMAWEPLTQMSESAGPIIEAVKDKDGREWDVILIAAGLSKNGNYYPSETLKSAASLFEGAYAFADHASAAEREARPERSIKDKVGRFSEVRFGSWSVRGKLVEGLRARFKVIAPWLRETLREAVQMGEPDFLGFSIAAEGRVNPKTVDGRRVNWVEAVTRVHSVDVVTDPAAGGQLVELVAANRQQAEGGLVPMDPKELSELVKEQVSAALADTLKETVTSAVAAVVQETVKPAATATDALAAKVAELEESNRRQKNVIRIADALRAASGLSEIGREQIRKRLVEAAERRDVADDEIATTISEQTAYEAQLLQASLGSRGIAAVDRLKVGDAAADKINKGIRGMFAGEDVDGVPRFQGLKEAYCRFSGRDAFEVSPFEITRAFSCKYDSAIDHKRLQESLTTASWGEIYADNLYVMMLQTYRTDPYNRWRPLVSDIESVPDFQTRHWARVGGYADLSTVAEQATYPTLTSPGDEEVTYAVSKKGGIDDVTFEAIVNDRFGVIRRLPVAMGRSAARTLFKAVMAQMTTTNPTMPYDSVALYHANHSNTGTTALSLSGLNTAIVGMRDQTAYGESSEILGSRNYPAFIIVPNELEQLALRLVSPSMNYVLSPTADTDQSIDPNAFRGKGIEVVVYDQLTDATDWFLVANPREVPTVVVGFLNGQQEPELFVQDQPNTGSVFSADKISYKVRHVWGLSALDHRSFYRMVV